MIAALYARYSSDNQREESIVAQLRAGREYSKRHGYSIIKEYADEAYSGTNDNRPGFQQMLQDAKAGMFEIVVFHKVDRNGRNEYDYYKNKQALNTYGVKMEYSAQYVDDSAEGQLSESILVGVSSYYSRNLSREVKKGLKENAYAGKITGGKPLFGYAVDADKKYVINDEEATAIRYVFESYAEGTSYLSIIAHLNSCGYKTRRGNSFGKNSLHDILRNRRYIGTCILGKNTKMPNGKRNNHRPDHDGTIVIENACPAIIDKTLFEKVGMKLDENKRRRGAQKAKREYLLSGLVFCGECGAPMHGTTNTTRKTQVNVYYRCSNKSNHGEKVCPNRYVSAPSLESLVLRKLSELIESPKALERVISKVSAAYNEIADKKSNERKLLMDKQGKLKKAMDNLYNLVEDGTADSFDLDRLKKVKVDLLTVQKSLTEINEQPMPSITTEQILEYIDKKFIPAIKNKSADNLRAIIESFIDKVVVGSRIITIRYKVDLNWCAW